jgi:hypothetical protein
MNVGNPLASALLAGFLALAPTLAASQDEPAPRAAPDPAPPPPRDGTCDNDLAGDPDCLIHIIAGAGSAGGAVSFNWNGPGRIDYGVYDTGCLDYEREFRQLVGANKGLIGSVAPQATSWEQTLERVRAGVADPFLGALLADVEQAPDDPMKLFNFAGALNRYGMVNEALAVTARIRALGPAPAQPLEINAAAALDYQEGYALMLLGNLVAAKSKFGSTIASEPFLNQASHALALIQAQEGNPAASTTYRDGMWRFKPKYLVICGDPGTSDVRPPVDDMYDTSMGKDVRLVEFWHPEIASELAPFFEQIGALAESRTPPFESLKQRMVEMSTDPRYATDRDDPYDAWAENLSQLINGLDEYEPYVLQAQAKLDAAMKAAGEVSAENQAYILERVVAMVGQPGNHCPTYRSLISQGIQGVRPHAEAAEAAANEYARIWYKMATGLASNIGDPEWFEQIDVGLRAEIEARNLGLLATMAGLYGFPADLVRECPEEFVQMFAPQVPPAPPADACDQLMGNMKLQHSFGMPQGAPGPKIDVSVGCNEIQVKAKWNVVSVSAPGGLAEFEMGARAEGTFTRGKGFDIFAGVGADTSIAGVSGSARSGVFMSGDAVGLTDAGGRVKLDNGTTDTMDFSLMAKPATPRRGPPLHKYRTYQ